MVEQGRRERKKLERRERILTCATEMFERCGFDATSLEAIADGADVSLRTLYNFFPTKLDMLVAGQLINVQQQIQDAIEDLADPPADPRVGLYRLMELHFRIFGAMDRDLLLRTAMHGLAQGPRTGAGSDYARSDVLSLTEVEQLLAVYSKNGSLPQNLDVAAFSRLIFSAGNGEFFVWLADREQSVDVPLAHLRTHIELLFETTFQSGATPPRTLQQR